MKKGRTILNPFYIMHDQMTVNNCLAVLKIIILRYKNQLELKRFFLVLDT